MYLTTIKMLTIHNIERIYGMGMMKDLTWQPQTDWTGHPHIWIGHPVTEPDRYRIPIWAAQPLTKTGLGNQVGQITILRNAFIWGWEWEGSQYMESYMEQDLSYSSVLQRIKYMWQSKQLFGDPFYKFPKSKS